MIIKTHLIKGPTDHPKLEKHVNKVSILVTYRKNSLDLGAANNTDPADNISRRNLVGENTCHVTHVPLKLETPNLVDTIIPSNILKHHPGPLHALIPIPFKNADPLLLAPVAVTADCHGNEHVFTTTG